MLLKNSNGQIPSATLLMAIVTCSARVNAKSSGFQRTGNDDCVFWTRETWSDYETSFAWSLREKKCGCHFSSSSLLLLLVR